MQNPVEVAGKIWVGRMQLTSEIRVVVNNEDPAGVDSRTTGKI